MDIRFSPAELAFREEVRAFLRDEYPRELRDKLMNEITLTRADLVRFQQLLHAREWAGINWPVEHGGTGWSAVQKYIFADELDVGHYVKRLLAIETLFGNSDWHLRRFGAHDG